MEWKQTCFQPCKTLQRKILRDKLTRVERKRKGRKKFEREEEEEEEENVFLP